MRRRSSQQQGDRGDECEEAVRDSKHHILETHPLIDIGDGLANRSRQICYLDMACARQTRDDLRLDMIIGEQLMQGRGKLRQIRGKRD